MKPTVGIVTTWFERGAAYVSRAYRELLVPDFDVQIYARGGESFARGNPDWDDASVWWSEHRAGTFIDRADFERWIDERGVGLILFNEQNWLPPVIWAHEKGCRTVAYVDFYTPELVPLFRAYDEVWCNTRRHHSVFENHPRARYIPWGTDLDLFKPAGHEPSEELIFFHSAGMGGADLARGILPRKGTDLATQAFRRVQGPARLIVHSQRPLAAFGSVTEEAVQADERIQFIEKTVPAPGLYHLGDVYLYPTRLEGIGLSIIEALACGLPVIATGTGPCNEFVVEGKSGWLVPVARRQMRRDGYYWPLAECDLDALVRIIQTCINERKCRPQWRANARDFATERLDWIANRAAVQGYVRELLASDPLPVPAAIRREILAQGASGSLATRLLRRMKRQAVRLRHDLAMRHVHA
ncbi:MAG: glycosyltransferase [Armatimonadetes bacterium]|nr:glycosyltransferase [Armatimonadota bacterium]